MENKHHLASSKLLAVLIMLPSKCKENMFSYYLFVVSTFDKWQYEALPWLCFYFVVVSFCNNAIWHKLWAALLWGGTLRTSFTWECWWWPWSDLEQWQSSGRCPRCHSLRDVIRSISLLWVNFAKNFPHIAMVKHITWSDTSTFGGGVVFLTVTSLVHQIVHISCSEHLVGRYGLIPCHMHLADSGAINALVDIAGHWWSCSLPEHMPVSVLKTLKSRFSPALKLNWSIWQAVCMLELE